MLLSIPPTLRAGTPDLPDAPPLVQFLLASCLDAIISWLTHLLLRATLLRYSDHPLLDLLADLTSAWLHLAPATLQQALPPLDFGPLHTPARCSTPLQRQELLVAAVRLTQRLQADLTPHLPALPEPARASIAPLLLALAKVLSDEISFDASDYPTERKAKDKGTYRIISPTDLDATFRLHDDDCTLGYNAAIATTATRIRAAVVLRGATPDSEAPAALLLQQRDAGVALPPQLVMDRAGGWGKTRAAVDMISEGQCVMVAHIPQSGGSDPNRFSVADFRYDPVTKSCTCPNGVTTTKVYAHGEGDGLNCRFTAAMCKDCPLRQQCRAPSAKPNSHRTVFISDYHPYLRQAEAFNTSAAGKVLLGQRWRVEPTIAWLVRYQGCRRARRVGQQAAECQLLWACGVRNLLLWLQRCKR